MPENEVQYEKVLVLEISPQISNTCSEAELKSNPGNGLTQKIANHSMENNFHFSPGSVQFFQTPLTSHLRFCYWNTFRKSQKLDTIVGSLITIHVLTQNQYGHTASSKTVD